RLLGCPYDEDGRAAADGAPDADLLDDLLADDYFRRPPPKSTGREKFGAAYVDALLAEGPSRREDLLATATALTARSVAHALERFVLPRHGLDVVIASGGGTHNAELMRQLGALLHPVPVRTTADYGVDPDAKEALCFAVLAHEFVNGAPTNLPAVTGAARPALLGKLSLP
ncbi:MAG: anhydro-N-acetylmuramic acid kinase, partial [Rhodothermales bacterium]|nr:anhydro-N-acetylmuramic acid kinase [Rhodothermales bacterium]